MLTSIQAQTEREWGVGHDLSGENKDEKGERTRSASESDRMSDKPKKRRRLLKPEEAEGKELHEITKRDHENLFDLHIDLRPDAESRIESMMQGPVHGMVTGPDREPTPKGEGYESWVDKYGKRKPGAVGYLFLQKHVRNKSNWLKQDAKPHSHAILTREGQTFHEAAVEKALAEGKHVPDEVLVDYPHLKRPASPSGAE